MNQVFIGRQPIFNRDEQVYAYELLWRSDDDNMAKIANGDQATTTVVLNALTEFGLDRLVGQQPAFINLTRNFILGELPLPHIADRVVLEILEDIEVDAQLIAGIKELMTRGYQVALDDFIYHPKLHPLVELADIIKIDILEETEASLETRVTELRRYPVKLLAEKIETPQQYQECRNLGFDYFQGYFFARPNIIKATRAPANKLAIIQLIAKLADPQITNAELEKVIMQDVTLSYRLLRYINSARYGLKREIDTIHHAIALLGHNTLRHLINLMALSRFDDKPQELMIAALVRARMMELLSVQFQAEDKNVYFTVGLFSILDAMMDQPMPAVLNTLPLSNSIKQILVEHSGDIGKLLGCVIAYDEADWSNANHPQLSAEQLRQVYFEAISWASETATMLAD